MNLRKIFNRAVDHPDAACLLLRVVFGGLMLFHGLFKVTHGVSWLVPILTAHHLPGFVALGAYIGEIVAPVLIIAGVFTRLAGLIYAINMLFAVVLVTAGNFWKTTEVGGWALETEALYLLGGIVIMLLGPGRYRLLASA